MSDWSRRDVFRFSAGAATAAAVPLAVVGATSGGSSASAPSEARLTEAEIEESVTGRVMVCVHDARRGEVSILQGSREVVVQDHQLVARVMRAARA